MTKSDFFNNLTLDFHQFSLSKIDLGIIWFNKKGRILWANQSYVSLSGYSLKELTQSSIFEISPTINLLSWRKLWNKWGKNEEIRLDTQHINKTGELYSVSIDVHYLNIKGTGFCCKIIQPLSHSIDQNMLFNHQKRTEEIQSKIAKLSLDNADNMVVWSNKAGELIYFNKALSSTLGYTPEELKNIKIYQLYKDLNHSKWITHWNEVKTQQNLLMETQYLHKNGDIIPVEASINYFQFHNQEFNCGIIRNLTKNIEKEQELAVAYQELRTIKEQFELENIYLKEEIRQDHDFNEIISKSNNYAKVLTQIQQVAITDATVLITGETGTGKELLVRALHRISGRSKKPLIKINCAVLPPNLIESELFGHEKGAFTGAIQKKMGRFELADQGTIFLDEIGELPLDLQAKLLRVLQEGEFERVGGTKTIQVNTRVIAATNRNLPEQVRKEKFREDLFYRLNVFPIHNIPLRERREDIPLLINFFMRKYGDQVGKKFLKVNNNFLESLQKYDFPGNIRELENFIERAVIISTPPELQLEDWADKYSNQSNSKRFKTFAQMQYDHILNALRQANWKVSGEYGAAELLDLNPKTLESKMRKLKISRKDFIEE